MATSTEIATRAANAGELVVPVSEILDRLRGRVGQDVLDNVLNAIIATRRNRVSPGELITADLINQILGQQEALETRITALEAVGPQGDAVVITGLLPSGPVTMGSELTVIGRNLGPPERASVIIDGAAINQFKAGSELNKLIFNLPALQGIPASGKIVNLTISNAIGIATTSFIILPPQPTVPTGSLFATYTQAPPDPLLLAGQSYTFVYTLKAITNMAETFTLTPQINVGWPVNIVDSNNIPITPAEISIPKSDPPEGTNHSIRVRVTIPAGTPTLTRAQLSLRVTSKRNPGDLTQTSSNEVIVVGSAPPPPQEIAISFSNVISPAPPLATENNGVVTIPAVNTQYRISFNAVIKDAGDYRAVITSPGTGWTVRVSGSATTTPLELPLKPTTPNSSNLVNVIISAQSGAATGALQIQITKIDDATVFGQVSEQVRLSIPN